MDIEQLKKITGMNDAELTSYILDRYNAGATNEEIMDELTSKTNESEDRPDGWDLPWEMYFTKETSPSWRSHTMPKGNSTPDDNGWTDLKKLGSSIGSGLKKAFTPNKAIDPLWQLGVIDDAFGDDSKFKMWNQNVEARKQREAQYEYNKMLKAMDEAQQEKEKTVAGLKAASDEKIAQQKAQKETDEKNLETFLNTINGLNTGRVLNDTEKAILKVQYNRLNNTDKNEYQSVYNKLYGVKPVVDEVAEGVETIEENVDEPTTTYGTPEQQSKHKTYVANEKSAIEALPNSTEKQTRMKKLNSYITKHGSSVDGGLGSQYTTKQINAAAPKKEYKLGDKFYGLFKDAPKLTGNLKWNRTGKINNKGETEFEVGNK